jgi:ABC-type Na+ efflux pump permease subunit
MIGATIRKDVLILLRDRSALISLFALPIVFMGVFGSMFSRGGGGGDQPRMIAIHRPADSRTAAAAASAIAGSGLFRVREEASAQAVEKLVASEAVAAGLVFPPDFDPLAGHPAELVIDLGASPQVRGPLEGALAGLVARSFFGAGAPPVLVPRSPPGIVRPLEDVRAFQYFVPGNAVLFGFFLALTVGISFIEERKSGTFRRILAAPIRRPALLLAKLIPFYIIGLIQMAFLFSIGTFAFGMRLGGSLTAFVCLTAVVELAAVSLGLVIASFSGTERQVGAIGSVCLLVMGLLGGGMVPRPFMPQTMRAVGLFTPHGWALDGYYDLLLRQGTQLADVLPQILALAGFGVGFALLGALRFRFER